MRAVGTYRRSHFGVGIRVFRRVDVDTPDRHAGSDYIKKIEARAPARGVVYTNIATRYDELVGPYTSSFLVGPNVTNIFLQAHCALDFSDHVSIISSPITGRYILNALDPAHALPPPCVPVAPAL